MIGDKRMNENYNNLQEHLLFIRQREAQKLEELRQSGQLLQYTLDLHKDMMEKYPEMITRVYTKEEVESEMGDNNE